MAFGISAKRFERLFRIAEGQAGFFTTEQALAAGYSRQLLKHHLEAKRVERWLRGVYRLVHFPQLSDHEDLVIYWLWSGRTGVFSHETALSMHELSDALPARVHMTLPCSWSARRLRVPAAIRLYYDDVPRNVRQLVDAVPITSPARTLNDCARDDVAPDLLQQAVHGALERKLVDLEAIAPTLSKLEAYAA